MKKIKLMSIWILSSLLISTTSQHVMADEESIRTSCVESMSAKEINHIEQCYSYVKGFLEGALITDAAIISTITDEKSGFFQRAYKTRVSNNRMRTPDTFLARFCLVPEQNTDQITRDVIKSFTMDKLTKQPVSQSVYDSLKKLYPCSS